MTLRLITSSILILALAAGCASAGSSPILFGIEMAEQGLWKEAAFRWRAQLEQTGPSPALLNNLAIAAESEGDFDTAERLYQQALKMAPSHPVILENHTQFKKMREKKDSDDTEPDSKRRLNKPLRNKTGGEK